jgi:hypothetical protein
MPKAKPCEEHIENTNEFVARCSFLVQHTFPTPLNPSKYICAYVYILISFSCSLEISMEKWLSLGVHVNKDINI